VLNGVLIIFEVIAQKDFQFVACMICTTANCHINSTMVKTTARQKKNVVSMIVKAKTDPHGATMNAVGMMILIASYFTLCTAVLGNPF